MQESETASVYQQVLRGDWNSLDPQLRAYFGPVTPDTVGIGRGVYGWAGARRRFLRPLLALMARRGLLFPEAGSGIPFTVVNVPEADGTLTAIRTFAFPQRTRVMSDTLAVVDGRLIERAGIRGGLEIALDVAADRGGIRLTSTALAVRFGRWRLPVPPLARVTVDERAHEDGQRVDVRIRIPIVGEVFRYAGNFTYERVPREQIGDDATERIVVSEDPHGLFGLRSRDPLTNADREGM